MGAFSEVIHALLIPALIAVVLYLVLSFLILPAIRRYRNRYDQYIPIQTVTDRVAAGTSTLRDRLADLVTRIVLPTSRGRGFVVHAGRNDSTDDLYTLEEGEEMDDFLDSGEALESGRGHA